MIKTCLLFKIIHQFLFKQNKNWFLNRKKVKFLMIHNLKQLANFCIQNLKKQK